MNILNKKLCRTALLISSVLSSHLMHAEYSAPDYFKKYNTENNESNSFLGIQANGDASLFNANGMELDIVANDRINVTEHVIVGGPNANATIEKVGVWPTGIYLSQTGQVIVVAGTIMPRKPLQYRIKNTNSNETSTAQIILFDASNNLTNSSNNASFYLWNDVDAACYENNSNERTFTLHIVNIGSVPQNIVGNDNAGYKFRINATSVNYLSDNDPNWSYTGGLTQYYKSLIASTEIVPFGEITFSYKKSSSTGSNTSVGLTSIRYGNMSANETSATPGNVITFTSLDEIKVDKIPAPGNKSKEAYIGHNWTAQSVSGITDTNISKYKFYKLENSIYTEILPNTPFPNASTGSTTYHYSQISSRGCEGPKSSLTVIVNSTTVKGGTVSATSNNIFCPGANILQINNVIHGDADNVTNLDLVSYSWEISTDNGINWQPLNDSSTDATYSYLGTTPLREGIIINNITNSILIRRKTTSYYSGTNNQYAYSNIINAHVQINSISFSNNVKSFSASKGSTFTLPTVTTTVPNSTIEYYDHLGAVITGTTEVLNTKGSFDYTVKAISPLGCEVTENFQVNVYDVADCTSTKVRTYANKAITWTSGASKTFYGDHAVNNNNAGYATLSGGVVLLGIGTVGIDLYFVKPDGVTLYTPAELAGKRVTLKLGEQYSGLKLAGGISVIARSTTATNSNNISILNSSNKGKTYGVKGGVLDLLKGDNTFMYSFIPKKLNGENAEFNGVRIQLGSLLGVADLGSVFYAYIEEEATAVIGSCSQPNKTVTPLLYSITDDTANSSLLYPTSQKDINGNVNTVVNENITLNNFTEDITWGNRSEVLNVASALSSIVYPYYAVDNDYNSYALFNSTVGVLNQQFLQVQLKQKAQPGDQIRLVLNYPNINLINLSLLQLGNFKLVYYLGDAQVGEDNLEQFRVMDIGLFNFGNNKKAVLTKPITVPFDRVELRQFQTINVNIGDGLRIYDIRIQPQMMFDGQSDPKQVTKICAAEPIGVQKPDYCTSYVVSLAKVLTWGDDLTDESGMPLYEIGTTTPIKSILAAADIPNSTLVLSSHHANPNQTFTDYYDFSRLYTSDEKDGILLLKIQSIRQGCNYGEPEYLRIRLQNCSDGIINPSISVSGAK